MAQGLPATQDLNAEVWDKLQATSDKPVVTDYTITDADASGPYVDRIPPKMEQQADLKAMDYTNPREMLAERFHMSRDLVSALNPGKPLDKAGTDDHGGGGGSDGVGQAEGQGSSSGAEGRAHRGR